MRFMVMVKATKDSEAGKMPTEQLLGEMAKYNEELVKAGIMLGGDGLQSSAKGARVRFNGPKRTVIDGPFAETKELVAGYWIWQCKSLAEAVEWVKRCPNPMEGESEIEIRQIFDIEDFGDSPAVEHHKEVGKQIEKRAQGGAQKITVETAVKAPIEKVWSAYTSPEDIKKWNAASDDWHTTSASVDLREGGQFSSRMEAKDGSFGFDFAGTYTKIVPHQRIEYAFGDRTAQVEFAKGAKDVTVRVTFEAESTHSIEQQRDGWQAILNNFTRHVEAKR
jgi:uncharacterized protein YndB with AHSA1/START domain